MSPTELRFTIWFVLVGALLVALALSSTVMKRLPLTTGVLYLAVGIAVGPEGFGLIRLDAIGSSLLLERATEIVVVISLFSAGLKLRTPLTDPLWHLPLRLASVSMVLTVGMVALVGVTVLDLPLGAAILLGGVLAPTDPVLASDVQVADPRDRDRLRFGLTGEAGLNDGTAFPFVMLGMALLGLREIGTGGWRWVAMDVVWATAAGLAIGGILGTLIGRLVLHLRREHKETIGTDDFLGLGLIALAYGTALLARGYGFLAVFAAGLALRRIERMSSGGDAPPEAVERETAAAGEDEEIALASDPEHAPAYMARAVLGFSEQLERMGTVAVVLLVGGMLTVDSLTADAIWFVPLLFLVIRPVSVWLGLLGTRTDPVRVGLMSWFGVRGIGSVYYLMFAVEHGLAPELAEPLAALALTTVAASVVVHGVSVTPLMRLYARWSEPERAARAAAGRGAPP